jgi:hypothetical protein
MAVVEEAEPVAVAARVTVVAAARAAVDSPAPAAAAARVTVVAAAIAVVEVAAPVAVAASVTSAAAAMAVVDDPAPVAVAARVRLVPVDASLRAIHNAAIRSLLPVPSCAQVNAVLSIAVSAAEKFANS